MAAARMPFARHETIAGMDELTAPGWTIAGLAGGPSQRATRRMRVLLEGMVDGHPTPTHDGARELDGFQPPLSVRAIAAHTDEVVACAMAEVLTAVHEEARVRTEHVSRIVLMSACAVGVALIVAVQWQEPWVSVLLLAAVATGAWPADSLTGRTAHRIARLFRRGDRSQSSG